MSQDACLWQFLIPFWRTAALDFNSSQVSNSIMLSSNIYCALCARQKIFSSSEGRFDLENSPKVICIKATVNKGPISDKECH